MAFTSLSSPPLHFHPSSDQMHSTQAVNKPLILVLLTSTYVFLLSTMSLPIVSVSVQVPSTSLPIRPIPGDYGIPFITPVKDRLDFFYFQGREEFFRSRIEKYNSTVYKVNMPPGPFISSNPNVIALLDAKSFPTLFDVTKVEKRDVFTGTYMPSLQLTGGYRVLAYLDPSEPKHAQLKNLLFFLLKSNYNKFIPEFQNTFTGLFQHHERELGSKGSSTFGNPATQTPNDHACFNFLGRSFYNTNPNQTKLGSDGPSIIAKWLFFQLHPILSAGVPWVLEDPALHKFPLPPFLVRSDYNRLYDFFYQVSTPILDEAERLGINRDEACHNLLFATCFNTFGGMKIIFPSMLKWVGRLGANFHTKLAQEIRSTIRSNNGEVTTAAMENMPLMKSVVYELFRIDPPVPFQYGKAKRDLIIESHDSAFRVSKGEMLFGYQPFVTRDPRIFERAKEFVPDRFVGEGEKLLKYVFWSNGRETENPTLNNKQCPGKNFVVLMARLFVVELFQQFDTFGVDVVESPLGPVVTLRSLRRATFQANPHSSI